MTHHLNYGAQRRSPDVSVLRSLRDLMPVRTLSFAEALQRAEAQATRLLELHQLTHGPVPIEIITEQPRIRLERLYDLPVSGSAVWDGGAWVITLNASEYDLRQRFSLLHEYKHIVDHPVRHLVQGNQQLSADDVAEKVADYFAACVLMPRSWVKTAYFGGMQSVVQLARHFEVSTRAMGVRLHQLGLVEPASRRQPTSAGSSSWRTRQRPTYFRARSTTDWQLSLSIRELAWAA